MDGNNKGEVQKEGAAEADVDPLAELMEKLAIPMKAAGKDDYVAQPSSFPQNVILPGKYSCGPGLPDAEEISLQPVVDAVVDPNALICAACNQPIYGESVSVSERDYHEKCFACFDCQTPFGLEDEVCESDAGELLCVECYSKMFSESCPACSHPITDRFVRFLDKKYHPEHFVCSGCSVNLRGKGYREGEGLPFCLDCKLPKKIVSDRPLEMCGKCHKPIKGPHLVLKGVTMHPEHFSCAECQTVFSGSEFSEMDEKLYCEKCWAKFLKNICHRCEKPIKKKAITALGRVWHNHCLTCAICDTSFSGGQFFEHENKAYCHQHYLQNFGKICSKCQKVVSGSTGITVMETHFHKDCYVCHGCDCPLFGRNTKSWEDRPMCLPCFKKLPKDIKKAEIKKQEQRKKMAKMEAKMARKK